MMRKLQVRQPQRLLKEQKPIWQNKTRSEVVVALCFILPSLIGVSIFVLVPFIDVMKKSVFGVMSGEFVGAKNYIAVFNNEAFKLASQNTFRFIVVCVPMLVILSLLLAVLVNSVKYKTELFKTTFLLPMAIPVASVVLLWEVLFHQHGLMSKLAIALGGKSIDWMKTDWAFWVLVGSYIWRNIGYNMVLWLAGLSNISPTLYEAAKVDGAGVWQRFSKITVPNLIPTLFTIVVLSLLNSFKVFREAYLVAGDYPHNSMYMLQHLFNNWFLSLEIDKLSAAATTVAGAILILILLLQKTWESEDEG